MQHHVATVIVSYNSCRWLDRCLGSLRERGLLDTTIVVDNASSDDTVKRIERDFGEVTLLRNERNLGFGKANNRGMALAMKRGADAVLLLNHDAWLIDHSLPIAVDYLVRSPALGMLAPLHVQPDGRRLDRLFEHFLAQSGVQEPGEQQLHEVSFVNGAVWLLARRSLERVGGFSPAFFHYGEDRDYAARLRYHGLTLAVWSGWRVVHDRAERRVGWDQDPKRQVGTLRVGLQQRLHDLERGPSERFIETANWTLGNLWSAVRAGYYPAVRAAGAALHSAWADRRQRHVLRQQLSRPGQHFLHD